METLTWIGLTFLGLFLGALLGAIPVMLLWNAVVPSIFGLKVISFMEALALSCLSTCLFKSGSTKSGSTSSSSK